MFTNFGNLFVTAPRHAESTDARLGIRKQDPDKEGRGKKGEGHDAEPVNAPDDSATVMVEALKVFLENFLKSMEAKKVDGLTGAPGQTQLQTGNSGQPPAQNKTAIDAETAKAASVYQHVAQKVDRNTHPAMAQDVHPENILGAEDIRTIHKLLQDLEPLMINGIEYLTIERSDSFLGSLVAAVEKAKSAL